MEKIVINATEGGAHIKGTKRMLLVDMLSTYCTKIIDKSALAKLRTLADDADALIDRVVPLLADDIAALKSIITHSKIGILSNKKLQTILQRAQDDGKCMLTKQMAKKWVKLDRETPRTGASSIEINLNYFNAILNSLGDTPRQVALRGAVRLVRINFKHSELAHKYSSQNPLVNVAIYGATRTIGSRAMKAKETIDQLFLDPANAKIRLKRNLHILTVAKAAATSLLATYTKTYDVLKEYAETKNNELLQPPYDEKLSMDDAETYFSAGNWAHPMLEATKMLKRDPCDAQAMSVLEKAIQMRAATIAKETNNDPSALDERRKTLRYVELIGESQEVGRQRGFDRAIVLLKEAISLRPKELPARWGLASAYHQIAEFDKSIALYRKLTKDDPENHQYKMELGQTLLWKSAVDGPVETYRELTKGASESHQDKMELGQTPMWDRTLNEGISAIKSAMELTNKYDYFIIKLAELYVMQQAWGPAALAIAQYVSQFPHDYKGWDLYAEIAEQLNDSDVLALSANEAKARARAIRPN